MLVYDKGYKLVEVQAPYGYVLDSTPVTFDITEDNATEENALTIIKVKKANTPQKGKITVTKEGESFVGVNVIGEDTPVYQPVFETTKQKVLEYHNHVHTAFCLESMLNLARNGRVPMAVAKIAGMLGIRVVGSAQDGQVTPVHKPRGAKKATQAIVEMMKERGFRDGNILRVAHCYGEEPALALRDAILAEFPNTRFMLEPTTALCSFYAEEGGLIIGFEGSFNTENDNRKF
jgi:hypothetical protein